MADNIIKLSGLQRFKENADTIYGRVKTVQGISPDDTGNVTIPDATSSKSGLLSSTDKSTIASLSTVATSGSYTDLKNVPTKVSQFTNDSNYITSSASITGNAATATALTTSAGSTTRPIYFKDGKPVETGYTLACDVPAGAIFTDTNTKVTNTLATTTKAYITGTTSSTTATGTQVFDTGVYLDTTAGQLTATTFNGTTGALSGNLTVGGTITATGTITGSAVYNAVYNDYAEFFPRGEETEPGDIIMLDLESDEEKYVKAYDVEDSNKYILIAGVHSDEYAHLIGGENPPEGEDFVSYNINKFIPVGLAGRCHVKIKGKAIKGAPVILSDIPGVGVCCTDSNIPAIKIVGYLVESDNKEEIRRLKIRLK